MIIAIVLAIIVAGVLVGILVVGLRPKAVLPSPMPTVPPSSGTTSPSHPTVTPTGRAGRGPATPGSFRDLRVPATFDTFTASPGGEYGSGRWIGTPDGGTSIGWWFSGTIGGRKGSLVGSIVQNASISGLNSYSFTNVTNVNGATCGSWLSSYEACFIAVDDGFVGVQVDRHDFGESASAGEVARLLAAYRAALS